MVRPPIQRVTLPELRSIFNTHVLSRINNGELIEIVRRENTPAARSREPAGTRSQRVEYWDTVSGRLVLIATVHRYLRLDSTLGASGLPDPKRVLHEGIVYAPHIDPPVR
jgi:hypothetical protein